MLFPPFATVVPDKEELLTDASNIPSIRHALIFLRSSGNILLVRNRKTKMITGIGGSLDPGETPYDAAARYLYDYGIGCKRMKLLGLLEFTLKDGTKRSHVHVLSAKIIHGVLRETEDSVPSWVRYTNIPYRKMPVDYGVWLPLLLQGTTFKGAFRNRKKRFMVNYKISVVYRGVERKRYKKFGSYPMFRWEDLDIDDSLDVSNAVYEGNPNDLNVLDQLSCDDKTPVFKNIDDIFDELKASCDKMSKDDELESYSDERSEDGEMKSYSDERSEDGEMNFYSDERSEDGEMNFYSDEKSEDGEMNFYSDERSEDGEMNFYSDERSEDGEMKSYSDERFEDGEMKSYSDERSEDGEMKSYSDERFEDHEMKSYSDERFKDGEMKLFSGESSEDECVKILDYTYVH